MVTASKLFVEPLSSLHCSQAFLHPGESCLRAALLDFFRILLSNGKYFAPLLISSPLLRLKSINRQFLLETVKFYLQVVGCATLSSWLCFFGACLFRNAFGKYDKYITFGISGFCGNLFSGFYPQRVLHLFHTATTQSAVEVLIRRRSNTITRLICDSKYLQVFLFMLNSALILHFKRFEFYNGFWFIQPTKSLNHTPKEADSKAGSCVHGAQTCVAYFFSGIRNYAVLGASLDLVKILLSSKRKSFRFWEFFKSVVNHLQLSNFKMTSFFLSYIGIYRLTSCLQRRLLSSDIHQSIWPHMMSGFLGGISYLCINELSLYSLSLVIAVQISWQWFWAEAKKSTFRNKIRKYIKISWLIMPLNIWFLSHTFIFRSELISSLGRNLLNRTTNYKFQRILESFESSDTDTIMRKAAEFTQRGFL